MATIRNLLIRLGVDVDPIDKGFAKAAKSVAKFDKGFSKINKGVAVGMGIGAAAGAASSLTAAILPAVGALVALPGALAVAQAATGTLKVGLIGVSDAMGALAEGNSDKLDKALQVLSPQAKKFVMATEGIVGAQSKIRVAVQDALFDGLAKEIKPLAANLMPSLQAGMVGVAGSFNTGAKELFKFGQTPVAKGALNAVFKTTKTVLDHAAKAVQPILKGIASLVVVGLPLAEAFAKWAINGIKAGAAFASSADGAVKLGIWAANARIILGKLGSIAGNVGGFLLGMFKGVKPSGDGVLDTLEEITAKMDKWANSVGGQERLNESFSLLLEILRAVVGVLPIFLGPLGAIMKIMTGLSPEVRGVVVQILAFSVVGVALAGKLSGLLGVVKGVTVGVVGTTAAVFKFGQGLIGGSAKLAENAGAAAKAGAAVRTFGGHIASGISTTASFVATNAKLALEHGKVALATAGAALKQGLLTTAQVVGNVASKALAIGVRAVGVAMKFALGPVGLIITAIGLLVAAVIYAYKNNETFRKIVDAVWAAVKNAIAAAWDRIKAVFNILKTWITVTLPNGWTDFKNKVSSIWNTVYGAISSGWEKVKAVLGKLKDFITVTIPNGFKTGVAAVGTFWNKLEAVAKKPVSFVVNTIYNNGIRKLWNWVSGKVGIGGELPEIKGFATGGPITQGTHGTADDVLMRASRGEYVVNAASTKRNAGLIDYVNKNGKNKDILKQAGYAGDPGGMGIPGYAEGGIVGWVSSFIKKGKDFFMNGFYKAANAALSPIKNLAHSGLGSTGIGGLLAAGVDKIVNGVLSKFKPLESQLGGGGGGKVVAAARSQIGVPYSWGGGGPGGPSYGIGRGAGTKGFDCSGLTEYAWYKAIGRSIGGVTYTQKQILQRISTPRPGAVGQPHADHTYLMSAPGKIIEAPFTGGFVREVPMRPTPWWGWPKGVTASSVMDKGGVVKPGWNPPIWNGTGRTEGVFTADMIKVLANAGGGGNTYHITAPVAAGTSPAEVGRAIVAAIKEYEKSNGTRWRGNP